MSNRVRTGSLLLVLFAATAGAQNWAQKSPQTSPPARQNTALAFDSAHGQVVLFGGQPYSAGVFQTNDTWVWDGTNWTQKSPQNSPPARSWELPATEGRE